MHKVEAAGAVVVADVAEAEVAVAAVVVVAAGVEAAGAVGSCPRTKAWCQMPAA